MIHEGTVNDELMYISFGTKIIILNLMTELELSSCIMKIDFTLNKIIMSPAQSRNLDG
jgi:hypothetical protein